MTLAEQVYEQACRNACLDELDHETQVKNVVDIEEQIGNLKVLENLRELWEFPTQALQFDFSKLSP